MTELKCLIARERIAERLETLAAEITRAPLLAGAPFTVVAVLNGSLIFTSDLVRKLALPLELDTLAAASYSGCASTGEVAWRSAMKLAPAGRDILLVDDILDTGLTLRRIADRLRAAQAARVRTCVLLDKTTARHPEGLTKADFTAFAIPDRFVVGYGLDAEERFRNLPDIMVLPTENE